MKTRKLISPMHFIQTYLLQNHLNNIERVCARDSHFKAIVLSVVPPDLFTERLPQCELLLQLLLWTRIEFAPAVDTVVLTRSARAHKPRQRPRLCDTNSRILHFADVKCDVDVDVVELINVLGVRDDSVCAGAWGPKRVDVAALHYIGKRGW